MASFGLPEAQRLLALGSNVVVRCGGPQLRTRASSTSAASMGKRSASSASLSTTAAADDPPAPRWNHSPNTRPEYVVALRAWLPKQRTAYVALVESHTVLDRRVICCRNSQHIADIQAPAFAKGSFEKPYLPPDYEKNLVDRAAALALSAAASTPTAPSPAPAPAASPGTSSGAPAATSPSTYVEA